jgi:hypothetical protein
VKRRRRVPELALGVLLMLVGALAGLILLTSDRDRTPVLALAGDVARGEVIEANDLRTVMVAADSGLAHVPADEADRLVGQAALTDLAGGSVVTENQFAQPAEVLAPGDGTVGLSLERGQLPSLNLAPGDRVKVVAGRTDQPGAPGVTVAEDAEVVRVEQFEDASGQGGTWFVSLRASEAEATGLAQAVAGEARVQLVLLGR